MRLILCLAALLLAIALPAAAAQPKCPLDVATCLEQFDKMRERPWLGVTVDTDSAGRRVVVSVEPNGPSARAGVRPGDELRSIEGKTPAEWFAGRAGWGPNQTGKVEVSREGKTVALKLPYQQIPDDMFARIIGVHMVEAHLAYMHPAHDETHGDK